MEADIIADTKENADTLADTKLMSLFVIEECLKKNKELENKLSCASRAIQEKLDSIRICIREVKRKIRCKAGNEIRASDKRIIYTSEWNDPYNPKCSLPNADTIAKHLQTGVENYYTMFTRSQTERWTGVQNRSLCSVIQKQEVAKRLREYSEKKFALQKKALMNLDSLKISALKKDVAEFDINVVEKKSLEELVLTGNGIYDWEKVSSAVHRNHTPLECKARWFHYLHPSVNRSQWTLEEDIRLKEIAERMSEQDWDAIAADLGTGRSAYACFTAYQSRLRGMDLLGGGKLRAREEKLVQAYDVEALWSRNDDCSLAAAVTKNQSINGIAWEEVMKEFPHKNRRQLFARWSQVLDPTLRGGRLTFVEQKAIVIGARRFGLSFGKIRNELIPHRTVSQLRHYTLYRINNSSGRGRWTLFVEHIFRAVIDYLGPGNWLEVRDYFPQSSVTQIKRRYDRQLGCEADRHTTIYDLPKNLRVSLSEADLRTCKLIDRWERIEPLGSFDSLNDDYEATSSKTEDNLYDVAISEEQLLSASSTSQKSPRDPLQEGVGAGSSKGNEEPCDSDGSSEFVEPPKCIRKRGRPPSRKKKKERTKPIRPYVRSGQFKVRIDENSVPKRSLRPKS